MPLLKEKPSELVKKSEVYFSIESGESQLAHTIEYVGAEHFVYASDIPHWDCEFPETWNNSVTTGHYRRRSRKKSYPRMPSDFSSCDVKNRVDNTLAAGVSANVIITMYRKRHPRTF